MRLIDMLLIFVPITLALHYLNFSNIILFISSILAIIPLAAKIGEATEELAKIYGRQIGGLLNATFGNSAELIIALLAINRGLIDLVKASLAGSIIGNLLFVLGVSTFLGGLKYREQRFSTNLAGLNSTMLLIAFMSIMIPSLFHLVPTEHRSNDEKLLSISVSILLISIYILSIIFSLKTHQDLFKTREDKEEQRWSIDYTLAVLILATIVLAVISIIFVSQIESVARNLGLTELFIGAIIVAIAGNAAEHRTAIFFALKNNLDLSISITVGSSLQIAMFVAPIAVLTGAILHQPMDLVFTPFEVIAVFASVLIVNEIGSDGKTNWFEGAQLIVMYLIIAALFYFVR